VPDLNSEYPERIVARVPKDFPRLVHGAASRSYISPSAYVRQAVSEKLTRDGFVVEPSTVPATKARAA
jgi:hypothetical protein